jgi:hypothetical protein
MYQLQTTELIPFENLYEEIYTVVLSDHPDWDAFKIRDEVQNLAVELKNKGSVEINRVTKIVKL